VAHLTRKLGLKPVNSEYKTFKPEVIKWLELKIESLECNYLHSNEDLRKISEQISVLKQKKKLSKKDSLELSKLEKRVTYISNSIDKTSKLIEKYKLNVKLGKNGENFESNVLNDYMIEYIKDCQFAQASHMNHIYSTLYAKLVNKEDCEREKEKDPKWEDKFWNDINKTSYAKALMELNDKINVRTSLSYIKNKSSVYRKKIRDEVHMCANGEMSLPNYKPDNPFYVDNVMLKIVAEDNKYYLLWGYNGSDKFGKFEIILNRDDKRKSCNDIICTLEKHIMNIDKSGDYKLCGSELFVKGSKIFISAVFDIMGVQRELDENTCVGVDLGIKQPAMCALNNNPVIRKRIGDGKVIFQRKTKFKKEQERKQEIQSYYKGGHGRKRKTQFLNHSQESYSNWRKNMNHYISKQIVKFALDNNAGVVKFENLKGINQQNTNLGDWTYFDLKEKTRYKCQVAGIKFVEVDPKMTSQTCSCCGKIGERKTRDFFTCLNPECESYKKKVDADYNAAINISRR